MSEGGSESQEELLKRTALTIIGVTCVCSLFTVIAVKSQPFTPIGAVKELGRGVKETQQ